MIAVNVNLVHVVIAAIASMVVGALWYSPALFAKPWMQLVGKSQEDLKKGATQGYIVSAIAALVTAYVLAHFAVYAGAKTWQDGVITGFWAWLGFVATTKTVEVVFEGRRKKLLAINIGQHLVGLVVMGAILAGWA